MRPGEASGISEVATPLRPKPLTFPLIVWRVRRTMSMPSDESTDLVKESLLYKEFLAEREEILRHKWIESEKAGSDIGFEKALLDWIVKHRSQWRTQRKEAGHAAS